MWTPSPVRKWSLPVLQAQPSGSRRSHMAFSSYSAGRVRLRRRTWIPAMVPWRASAEGEVTPELLDWYGRFARGRPGALVVEATGIRDIPSGPLLRIGDDRFVPGLERLVERVCSESCGETRLYIQLIDFLAMKRRPSPDKYFSRFLQLSPAQLSALESTGGPRDEAAARAYLQHADVELQREILSERQWRDYQFGARQEVGDLDIPEIRDLPQALPALFLRATQRARTAGFDGVELHYAHAYTMASLLSARNQRTDGYGGSARERRRLPLEVLREVRSRLPDDFVIGLRMLSEECIEGGSGLEDSSEHALALASAGADFISLSRGGKFEDAAQPKVGAAAYPYTGPSGYECMPTVRSDDRGPFGRNEASCAAIRRALRERGHHTPVVVAGGICSFGQIDRILREGVADVVASARQSLADPDWFLALEDGRDGEIRRCEFTNYCEALDQRHAMVTCKLWDRVELDQPGLRLSPDGRRRLVAPLRRATRDARER